jgi:translation initiation factor 3 subunit E
VQYECGNYTGASEYLYFHRILVQPTDANYLNGMWGKLAAEILLQNWDTALEDLNRLKQFIDESTFGSSLQTLQQRTWLIHWSLFVFFNHPKVHYFYSFFILLEVRTPFLIRRFTSKMIVSLLRNKI